MSNKKKIKCVRCESLDRRQKSPHLQYLDEEIPICDFCLQEIAEEEEYFKQLEDRCITEELIDEHGSCEEFD